MTELVPPEDIERLVGTSRMNWHHAVRVDTGEKMVYILHSRECKESGRDLRECPFSRALDMGVNMERWSDYFDEPMVAAIERGRLIPVVGALS